MATSASSSLFQPDMAMVTAGGGRSAHRRPRWYMSTSTYIMLSFVMLCLPSPLQNIFWQFDSTDSNDCNDINKFVTKRNGRRQEQQLDDWMRLQEEHKASFKKPREDLVEMKTKLEQQQVQQSQREQQLKKRQDELQQQEKQHQGQQIEFRERQRELRYQQEQQQKVQQAKRQVQQQQPEPQDLAAARIQHQLDEASIFHDNLKKEVDNNRRHLPPPPPPTSLSDPEDGFVVMELYGYSDILCQGERTSYQLTKQHTMESTAVETDGTRIIRRQRLLHLLQPQFPQSLQLVVYKHSTKDDTQSTKILRVDGRVQVYAGQYQEIMVGTIHENDSCVDLYGIFASKQHMYFLLQQKEQHGDANDKRGGLPITSHENRPQVSRELQSKFATTSNVDEPHTRFVFSVTSAEYFGYQVFANAYSFLHSNQTNASWLRLLSCSQPDDLAEQFPTFTAPKSIYSNYYSPINKADIIDKWMNSAQDAPHPNDTIVVIDPDNWLLKDVHPWTKYVKPKQAVGQIAYYGDLKKQVLSLWKDICIENCHSTNIARVGVPYIVKASDLKEIAPLWRTYSIIIKERLRTNKTFEELYLPSLGVNWAAEMFGYNFACTHLNIETKVVNDLQLRDTDYTPDWEKVKHIPMIHMGRAWFPHQHAELARPWHHTDQSFSGTRRGIQVWCKCNDTAAKIQPWPIPDSGMEFVSYHTLRILHESIEYFGPVPVNETFRKQYHLEIL